MGVINAGGALQVFFHVLRRLPPRSLSRRLRRLREEGIETGVRQKVLQGEKGEEGRDASRGREGHIQADDGEGGGS